MTDISGDFLMVCHRFPVAITANGETQSDILAAVLPISLKEAKDSQGQYTSDDVAFLVSQKDVTERPPLGSTISEGDESWVVIAVRVDRITHRFRIVCRSSKVIGSVIIQTASFALDEHGVQVTTWEDGPEVPATVAKDTADLSKEHQVEKMKTRFSVFFLTGQTVTKNTRIKQGELILRPTGLGDIDELTDLLRVKAEEW